MSILITQHLGETIDDACYRIAGELLREHGDHDQSTHGRKGGGITLQDFTNKLETRIDDANKFANKEDVQRLKKVTSSVTGRMDEKTIARLDEGLKDVVVVNDGKQLTKMLADRGLVDADAGEISASYMIGAKAILVGSNMDGQPISEKRFQGIMSHEMMHAIDGGDQAISGSTAWKEAWQTEVKDSGKMTNYAATNPAEGLAEFGRLLWSTDIPREKVNASFPKMVSVLETEGVL